MTKYEIHWTRSDGSAGMTPCEDIDKQDEWIVCTPTTAPAGFEIHINKVYIAAIREIPDEHWVPMNERDMGQNDRTTVGPGVQ